ncbi:MAG: hypothetical protein JXN64_00735 [Spirochaetes bacterium]|nr:hypothetical protein [Spirochaetota bacterium]
MEIKKAIFCTLDSQTETIIREVFDLLPPEIREFHQHICCTNIDDNLNSQLEVSIQNARELNSNIMHTARDLTTGFSCDLFILARTFDAEKVDSISQSFKDVFYKDGNLGNYDEIVFDLSGNKINYKKEQYKISNNDSHGTRLKDEDFYERIKYFFLFFLTSDLWSAEKLTVTNSSFYFKPNPAEKYFKSFAMAYDGLPIFALRDFYFELLKEKYLRNLLQSSDEDNYESAINKVKNISSLEVKELVTPKKRDVPLKLSFFSTKKGRKEKLEQAFRMAKAGYENYDKGCHTEAKTQRIATEEEVKEKIPPQISNTIKEIFSFFKSIALLRKLLSKLLDRNGGLYGLVEEKETEIFWPDLFRFSLSKLSSHHPNWLVVFILTFLTLLPHAVDYFAQIPQDMIIYSNIFSGGLLIIYIIFSIFNLRSVRKKFINNYNELLQRVQDYYCKSFKSFCKYLEVHIIKIFIEKLVSANNILEKNQAFLSSVYLTDFVGGEHYNNIKQTILDDLKDNNSFSFAVHLKSFLIEKIKENENCKGDMDRIINIKDPIESCEKILNIIAVKCNESKISFYKKQIENVKIKDSRKIIDVVYNIIENVPIDYDLGKLHRPLPPSELDFEISNLIRQQNFDNLLSEIMQAFNYSPKESAELLIKKQHLMFYLSNSQNPIDPNPKKLLFTPEPTGVKGVDEEYKNSLKIICGLLCIYDLKIEEEKGA